MLMNSALTGKPLQTQTTWKTYRGFKYRKQGKYYRARPIERMYDGGISAISFISVKSLKRSIDNLISDLETT